MSTLRPTREEMCATLVEAEVDFPPTASISQIRVLYDDLLFGFPSQEPTDPPASGNVVLETTQADLTSAPDVATLASVTKTSAIADKTSAASVSTISSTYSKTAATSVSSEQTLVTSAPSYVPSAISSATSELAPAALSSAHAVAAALVDNFSTDAQLDAELSRLRKQKEILDLKRALSGASSQSAQPLMSTPVRIELSAVESMVSPFSGDDAYDVTKWFSDLEDAFSILQFDERARFVGCRRLTTGTASAFLRTISVSNYDELKRALLKEFGRSFTLQEVFMCLQSRRIKAGESLRRYVIEMQEIASRAAVPENELIDLIIEGMGDKSNNAAMLYGATTMDEFKVLLNRYERRRLVLSGTAPNRSVTTNGAIRTQQAATTRKVAAPNLATTTSASGPAAPTRCFNCSRYGHYQSECPAPKRPEGSCFRCGSLSHVYRNCPKRASVQAAAVQSYDHENAVVEGVNALQMSEELYQ